jgi:hypothetical protein
MPLAYLLGIMRDEDQDARSRLTLPKAAAPYCHARLSSTELSGPSGGRVSVQKLDISRLNDEELRGYASGCRLRLAGVAWF